METSRTTVSVRRHGPRQGATAVRIVKTRATAARRGPGVVPRAPRHPRGVFGVYWSDFASLIADLMRGAGAGAGAGVFVFEGPRT